ncbi:type II toxin-antitoxin system RelE family toxin [Desulfobulbus alkaliphilus]|uniref:type II toxin-antitoxin system RelE family toxin n=1 Tax=Desulfobulbus alkaliphilus TaxID=869814 RepID=UPI001964DAA1|nr:type II toxin-antitoxin system mRNA interferase toxin, RelE/StbE family [Desulfobulbus alkaliphilus]MBM9538138.1 type II toxin-antitoxin system mRNA interferase toxin, RelE/StbE family [Desulfobulbus alkaliphilus]
MKVRFTKSFAKDLRNQRRNQNLLQQVQKAIEQVEQAETIIEVTNLKQLKAEGRYHRIRIGDYRLGLTIENDLITFVRFLHRRKIYRFFP